MKIAAYEVRPDEKPVLEAQCEKYGIELIFCTAANLDKSTVDNAEGADAITTLGQSDYCDEVLDKLSGFGVKILGSRCVGWNHMNVAYAKKLGFKICHGSYPPNGVAEYTIMAMLLCNRRFKKSLYNTNDNDFTLKGKMGREIVRQTVGVVGCGNIGATVVKILSGFGCRILAYDVFERDDVKQYAKYVDLDTIYKECDIITLHMPLLPSTTGFINDEAIANMKDGVTLINNARGELVDIDAVIKGIETGKIGQLFMDAFPGETGIIHVPHDEDIIHTPGMPYFKLKYLRSFINVYHTPHMAFFTAEAGEAMVVSGIEGVYECFKNGRSTHEIPEMK